MTSAPPSIAQRTHCASYAIDTDACWRTTNPFAHPNDFWWRSASPSPVAFHSES